MWNIRYLSHCYSIACDRLKNHLCHSVSLSVNTPTAAILIRFWCNFAQSFKAREVRSSLFGIKSDNSFPYLTLPPGRTGSYTCPAQRLYQLGPMCIPECNHKVTSSGYKAVDGCEAVNRRSSPSPILPKILKNLHYGLWGLQSGITRSTQKIIARSVYLPPYFRGWAILGVI